MAESPDVLVGMRLLDLAKTHGFGFRRLAAGPDEPLWGVRDTEDWHYTIYMGGFWAPRSCRLNTQVHSEWDNLTRSDPDLLQRERSSGSAPRSGSGTCSVSGT